tara:strand:- start:1084 stop:1536 length:453 start_codon:yes stop_codon:yes gene_type:complete
MRALQFISLIIGLILLSCVSDKRKVTTDFVKNPLSATTNHRVPMPKIHMEEDSYDFGDIIQGELVAHEFVVRNIGDDKLLINSAKGSCGCTVPVWPKEPILPGEEGTIKVTFNSAGREGIQRKTVTLLTNVIPNTKVITINGNVIIPNKQ